MKKQIVFNTSVKMLNKKKFIDNNNASYYQKCTKENRFMKSKLQCKFNSNYL